jgi:hypothetical protein
MEDADLRVAITVQLLGLRDRGRARLGKERLLDLGSALFVTAAAWVAGCRRQVALARLRAKHLGERGQERFFKTFVATETRTGGTNHICSLRELKLNSAGSKACCQCQQRETSHACCRDDARCVVVKKERLDDEAVFFLVFFFFFFFC